MDSSRKIEVKVGVGDDKSTVQPPPVPWNAMSKEIVLGTSYQYVNAPQHCPRFTRALARAAHHTPICPDLSLSTLFAPKKVARHS
jgi:hypothetical protein